MRRIFTIERPVEYMEFNSYVHYNCNNMPDILVNAMDEDKTETIEDKYNAQFFIIIKIEYIDIPRKFLLICKRTETWIKCINECVVINVDMITLQDIIKYQDITYRILEGYVCRDRRDHRIRTFIKELYDKRVEFKKEEYPAQLAIKLIMNYMYGKSIQRLEKTTNKIVNKEQALYLWYHKYQYIESDDQISNDMYVMHLINAIEKQYNNVIIGITVLSISKRIMNEIMCADENLNIGLYYQDTDSMFFDDDRIDDLVKEFRVRYGRELIGTEIGQFHNDIDDISDGYMNGLIVVGKKCYYDEAANDNIETADHIRMKGIFQKQVIGRAIESYNGDLKAIYLDLLNDWMVQFDLLTVNSISLDYNNERIIMKDEFKRNVKATGIIEKGSNCNIRGNSNICNEL